MTGPVPRVPVVRLEVPDYDLGLRGKTVRADKLAGVGQASMCTIVYGLSVADDVTDTPLSSAQNGYPDAFARPDETTRVVVPWLTRTEAVIADMHHADGRPVAESPRTVLRRLLEAYRTRGLEPMLGYEYEAYVMEADHISRGLRPLGRTINAYSLLRLAESSALAEEFMSRMESIGVPVEAFHSELGPGFFEFALSPANALEAADRAARARQCFRELCAEQGLRGTFMAKVSMSQSGSGGHIHQSLTRNGENVFSDGQGQLSDIGRHYLAGLLETMSELTVLFNPFLNSYKRLDTAFFVPTRATWGFDDRRAACRAIVNTSVSAARVEHRRAGADANPYLAAVGMLAGGLHGLEEAIELNPPLRPGDDASRCGGPLPTSLEEALAAFEASSVAQRYLGEELVASYAATRHGELAAFKTWWAGTVTDWELTRYLEHV